MIRAATFVLALCLVPGMARAGSEPVVGLPCEGCEAIFIGMPATLGWEARLAPPGLDGEPLVLEGTVRDRAGKPARGIVVYAYQTNADGVYPPDDRTRRTPAQLHGGLRGWAKTDARGRYRFLTIRPGGYPESEDPQHIHMHVLEPGRCTYFIDGVHFDDDPRLPSVLRLRMLASRGGRSIVTPARDGAGRWRARRDIKLGQGIPDYDTCAQRGSSTDASVSGVVRLARVPVVPTLFPAHQRVLDAWLRSRRHLRLMTLADLGEAAREEIDPDHYAYGPEAHPCYVAGDFSGDGRMDFAVLLFDAKSKPAPGALAIFNGPFPARGAKAPAHFESGHEIENWSLWRTQHESGTTLWAAPFASDHITTYVWKRGAYVPDWDNWEEM